MFVWLHKGDCDPQEILRPLQIVSLISHQEGEGKELSSQLIYQHLKMTSDAKAQPAARSASSWREVGRGVAAWQQDKDSDIRWESQRKSEKREK